jgi:uncharacterized protein YoxC
MEDLFNLGFGSDLTEMGKYLTYFVIAVVLYFVWKVVLRGQRGNPVRIVNKDAISVKFGQDTPKNINHNGKPENQKKVVQYLNDIVIDSTFWFLLVFTYGIGVIIRYINNLMTNKDFDRLLESKKEEVASQIADRALEAHGMDADEVREIPPILAEDFNPKSRFSRLCRDLTFRASEYQMTYLMFSDKQMYAYKHTFDLTSADTNEQTNEFFYEDITSVDIVKTQRDMPVPRSWQYIALCLSSFFFIPLSVLPFVAMSILPLKLFIFVFVCVIACGFWILINRVIENGIWKQIIKAGIIILTASITLHLFAKSEKALNEIRNERDNVNKERRDVQHAKNQITGELNRVTVDYNQITQQMNKNTERINILTADVKGVGDYSDLPAHLIWRIEDTKRQINSLIAQNKDLKVQIENYKPQTENYKLQIEGLMRQIEDYDMQIKKYNNRIQRNEMFIVFLGGFSRFGGSLVAISGLILLFTVGFARRVVEKLILRLTVAGDEFECAMNPDNIKAIQGMKAKIREKKKA